MSVTNVTSAPVILNPGYTVKTDASKPPLVLAAAEPTRPIIAPPGGLTVVQLNVADAKPVYGPYDVVLTPYLVTEKDFQREYRKFINFLAIVETPMVDFPERRGLGISWRDVETNEMLHRDVLNKQLLEPFYKAAMDLKKSSGVIDRKDMASQGYQKLPEFMAFTRKLLIEYSVWISSQAQYRKYDIEQVKQDKTLSEEQKTEKIKTIDNAFLEKYQRFQSKEFYLVQVLIGSNAVEQVKLNKEIEQKCRESYSKGRVLANKAVEGFNNAADLAGKNKPNEAKKYIEATIRELNDEIRNFAVDTVMKKIMIYDPQHRSGLSEVQTDTVKYFNVPMTLK